MTDNKSIIIFIRSILLLSLILIIPAKNISAQEGHANCFVYHRVGDSRYPSTNITTEAFREQLNYLKENNYEVMTLGSTVDLIRSNESIPARAVIISIDDGYRSFYKNGLPLLEEFGFPATLFLNPKTVGGGDYMDWDEINDARQRGIEIGNHSYGHTQFLNIENDDERKTAFIDDLQLSHESFMAHMGYVPTLYSYPFGEYEQGLMNVLEEEGYKGATAQYSGVLYHGTNLLAIPRFPMGGPYANIDGFTRKIQVLPMRVIEKIPEDIRMSQNPPLLQLSIVDGSIDPGSIQCFVDGEKNCDVKIVEENDKFILKVTSKDPLNGRRSLYTITARSENGKGWCWFSHVWVNTKISKGQ
ncbi:MAG: polysaccharide deacetylase family protein [Bacteroidales bacterium]|nr:polysaccharide deacetylase family protein [Bacteroidales bacterium]